MTLHIALEGIDGVGKTTLIKKLVDFFTKKEYNVTSRKQPASSEIIGILNKYNLTSHEIALLMAFDRSFTYYMEDWEQYDLVIWDRSILSSYVYNTDEKTTKTYIKQINKYFPEMDLYIILTTDKPLQEQDYTENNTKTLIQKYNQLIQENENIIGVKRQDNIEKTLKETVLTIFDNLPRCQWCGKLFKPNRHQYKYCKNECSIESKKEQYRINNRAYYHRYKDVMGDKQKGQLGSKGANLHGTADLNPLMEMQKIRRAKKALGLKPIMEQ